MNYRAMISGVIFSVAVFLFMTNCATNREVMKTFADECCGLRINSEYDEAEKKAAKIIYYDDGTWIAFESERTEDHPGGVRFP
jgi:hypothetical protein